MSAPGRGEDAFRPPVDAFTTAEPVRDAVPPPTAAAPDLRKAEVAAAPDPQEAPGGSVPAAGTQFASAATPEPPASEDTPTPGPAAPAGAPYQHASQQPVAPGAPGAQSQGGEHPAASAQPLPAPGTSERPAAPGSRSPGEHPAASAQPPSVPGAPAPAAPNPYAAQQAAAQGAQGQRVPTTAPHPYAPELPATPGPQAPAGQHPGATGQFPAAPAVPGAPGAQGYPGAPAPYPPTPGAPGAQSPYAPPAVPGGFGQGPGVPPGAGPWQYDPWAADRRPPKEEKGKPVTRSRIVTGALIVALVAGGIGGGIGAWLERDGGPGHRVTLPQAPAEKSDREPGSIAGIAARALPGVVTLHVRGSGGQGTGTGFVLDKTGHILTNNHVVEAAGDGGSGEIQVTFNGGQTAKATVVGRDSGYDLAVVKVSGVSGLTPLPLGNSDSVHVGDSVVAIGAPFDLAGTVTTGIISAKERPITAGGKKQDGSDVSYVDALQTDAPINPGNSGGPLVDSRGRVIGINSAIRSAGGSSESGGQGGSIGLGFAIPINQAKRVAEELINTGRATHPVIGVSLDMEYQGAGARVNPKGGGGTPVSPGGPADKAGIAPGDVIKKVDDVPIRSGQELIVKIRSHRPGDRLTLTVERDGKERTVQMTLGTASSR
ncbi:trypsin-like peptidase domain-containing protein [Streptomyces sp. I05A-00742]|uniref:S1C family serine protease n=1 Tax=Streptomyces sp. I05A-00742 TaxID=2732853 RepID=UPI0014880F7A